MAIETPTDPMQGEHEMPVDPMVMPDGEHPAGTDATTGWQGNVLELISEDAKRWGQNGDTYVLPQLDPWTDKETHY